MATWCAMLPVMLQPTTACAEVYMGLHLAAQDCANTLAKDGQSCMFTMVWSACVGLHETIRCLLCRHREKKTQRTSTHAASVDLQLPHLAAAAQGPQEHQPSSSGPLSGLLREAAAAADQ